MFNYVLIPNAAEKKNYAIQKEKSTSSRDKKFKKTIG